MNLKDISARVERLEDRNRPASQVHCLWGDGKLRSEIEAEKAKIIKEGERGQRHTFYLVGWKKDGVPCFGKPAPT